MKNGAEETNKNRGTMKTGAQRRKESSLKKEAWPVGILFRGLICASKPNAIAFAFIRWGG